MSLRNTALALFFCLLSSFLTAQVKPTDYAAKWKQVDSLVRQKGLVQSALTEVNKIYALARQEKNDAQVIKALLYRVNLQESTREDATLSSIEDLEKEIALTGQPARSILLNIQAGIYWNYFQQHRWQLYNRTATINYIKKDIATWSAADLHQKIGELYLASIQDQRLLEQTKLDTYDPILLKGNTRTLRPTLFDLLAHQALDYFKTDERDADKPAYAFEIDDVASFADAATFTNHSFTTWDSLSLHFKALLLFQRLLRLHISDTRPDAFIDLDIERLNFVYSYAVAPDKEDRYLQSLVRLTDRYGNEPAAAEAWYLQAVFYSGQANDYDPIKDTAHRYEYVKAKAICEKVLASGTGKDSSEGVSHCEMLLRTITRKELQLQTEKVNIPGQPMRTLVGWRNFQHLYVRVIRTDQSAKEGLGTNSWQDIYWKKLVQLPVLQTFDISLPATGDFQYHRTEIKVDALPVGEYILLASADKDFSLSRNPLAVQFFYVSSIAFINTGGDYFVLNRESGQPLAAATVQEWMQHYDYKTSKNILDRGMIYHTDETGHFIPTTKDPSGNNVQRVLEISTTNDHLFLADQQQNVYYYNQENNTTGDKLKYEKDNRQSFFFTDRSIYRPGQSIYFKGIVVTKDADTRQPKVQVYFKTKVILSDANGSKVDSLTVTTNEFGSYHGQFRLPENLLNGQFTLEDDSTGSTTSLSVEEYKRPKFFVEYAKLKGSYRVGDTIRINGTAKAYAGNNIDGATVKYRVQRKARYPYPWYFSSWRRQPATQGQEIAHGETRTDAEGKFIIDFSALPDLHINKELDPTFEYQVSADITDINGETRSGETTASVGYKVLKLTIDRPAEDLLPADSLKELAVSVTNLSGEPEPATVQLSVYKLRAPDRLLRFPLWQEEPDQAVISQADYRAAFPHDPYMGEMRVETWEKESSPVAGFRQEAVTVGRAGMDGSSGLAQSSGLARSAGGRGASGATGSSQADTNRPSSTIRYLLQGQRLLPGVYLIEARSKDKYGQEVKSLRYINLVDGKTGRPATPQYDWITQHQVTVEPGEKASVAIGSSAEKVFVIRKTVRAGSTDWPAGGQVNVDQQVASGGAAGAGGKFITLTLNNERKRTDFPVTETDRGGFGVSDVFIKDNRVFINQHTVKVPWTNKALSIQYSSFRDKTLPGSAEQWQVKITGYKKDKVAAEAVAALYDASLDQFKMHNWSVPDLYPSYDESITWNTGSNFLAVESQAKYENEGVQKVYVKSYDRLLPVSGGQMINIRGTSPMSYNAATQQGLLKGRVSGIALTTGRKMAQIPDKNNDGDGSQILLKDKVLMDVQEEERQPAENGTQGQPSPVQIRRDLKETAFFLPDLRTDSAGNISFSFTMPESLTRWKALMLAHTRDLSVGYSEKTVVTQKKLMVQPNAPRFLREGDRMELSAKVVNLTDSELTGQVELQLIDPTTGQTADGLYTNQQPNQFFTVAAGLSTVVSFPLDIPYQYNRPLTYRIVARAGLPHSGAGTGRPGDSTAGASQRFPPSDISPLSKSGTTAGKSGSPAGEPRVSPSEYEVSDGEEATLPVVSNRMLVTETLPLNLPGNGTRNYTFDKLLQSGSSETLSQYALTVEFTSNPAWYAIQALPYLMEYPYDCAEQTFNRFYANALASKIAGSSPLIQAIFDRWKTADTAALLSNLEKNPELKSVLLQETPWVLQGKSESQQKRNVALLFDMSRMSRELESALQKLQDLQSPNGGFVWFKGGPDDRYMTQYILTGIGRLQKLKALPPVVTTKINEIVKRALPYLDQQIKKEYEELKKQDRLTPRDKNGWVGEMAVNYLYMRSSFSDYGIPGDVFPAVNYYRKQAQQLWLQTSKYMQGMIALALYRSGDIQTAKNILASLRQTAIRDEEKGMYWKGMEGGYYWYQAPIEIQSLMIEAFHEIGGNTAVENDLRTWLLRQKQTHNWATTKATADACYALLLGGSDWLGVEKKVEIRLGDKLVRSGGPGVADAEGASAGGVSASAAEAGTGYFKKIFDGPFVNPSMGKITVNLSSPAPATTAPAWGAVYWQYFDNLDRITPPGDGKAPLKLVKKLFVERNTDRGPVLEPVEDKGTLHVGDKVKVRIELQSDRELEYVHMKDMRAACMEPVNVLSGYKWQGGLGYYESTKDVSTDFFFSRLARGTYIFEYALFVGQVGNFSNGITSIECLYAPEFGFHSEGIRVNVE